MSLVLKSATAPEWFRIAFFVGLGLAWWGFCSFRSFFGGWYWLGRTFPRRQQAGATFFLSPMSIGTRFLPLYYRGLCVRLGPDGLDLSVLPAFRALHHPLTIPWRAIECTIEDCLGEKCTAVHIANPRNRLLFMGNEGAYIYDYWAVRMGLAGDGAQHVGGMASASNRGIRLLRSFRARTLAAPARNERGRKIDEKPAVQESGPPARES